MNTVHLNDRRIGMEILPNGMKRIDRKDGRYDYSAVDIVVDAIVEDFSPRMIVIFGSVAKGTADGDSDLDILIVMDSDKPHAVRSAEIQLGLWKRNLLLDEDVIVVTPEEFERMKGDEHSFVYEIMSTGVIAYKT